jgi:hypothetical protein
MKMKHALTAQLQVFAARSLKEAAKALGAPEHLSILEAVAKSYMGSTQHAELQMAAVSALAASCHSAGGAQKAVVCSS